MNMFISYGITSVGRTLHYVDNFSMKRLPYPASGLLYHVVILIHKHTFPGGGGGGFSATKIKVA